MADEHLNTPEAWKAIPDFPGYEVSDQGRVRSYWCRGGKGPIYSPTIKRQIVHNKYFFVRLQQNGKTKTKNVHNLVLLTFSGPCPIGMEACHNDGNCLKNHHSNLRWDTRKNNSNDKVKHGTLIFGEKNYNAKLTEEDVIKIRNMHKQGCTLNDISKEFNVSKSNVSMIANRRRWKRV